MRVTVLKDFGSQQNTETPPQRDVMASRRMMSPVTTPRLGEGGFGVWGLGAETVFGQTMANPILASPFLATVFWARPIWANPILANPMAKINVKVVSQSVWPRRVGPRRVGAEKGVGPKISRFSHPLPLPFSLCLSLFGCLPGDFWWCLKRRRGQIF